MVRKYSPTVTTMPMPCFFYSGIGMPREVSRRRRKWRSAASLSRCVFAFIRHSRLIQSSRPYFHHPFVGSFVGLESPHALGNAREVRAFRQPVVQPLQLHGHREGTLRRAATPANHSACGWVIQIDGHVHCSSKLTCVFLKVNSFASPDPAWKIRPTPSPPGSPG